MTAARFGSASAERTGSEGGDAVWPPDSGDPALADASAATDRCREWRLPSTVSSVTALRRGLHAFLKGTSLSGEALYDLVLAACEAASNAVEHAQYPSEPFFYVLIEVDDERVSILVRDFGQWCDDRTGPHRGRGLGMMRALTDMSLVSEPDGTTVTLRSRGVHAQPPGS